MDWSAFSIGQKKSLPGGRLNHYRTTSTIKTHFLGYVTDFLPKSLYFFILNIYITVL